MSTSDGTATPNGEGGRHESPEIARDTHDPTVPDPSPPRHEAPDRGFWRRRPGLTKVAIVVLCGLLGLAMAAQVRNNQDDPALQSARQGDLVQILDELESRQERLRAEIADLQARRAAIDSDAAGSESALAAAQRRQTELGILAGTVAAQGPGLLVRLVERDKKLPAEVLLDAVEELRGAGAEAMQIRGAGGDTVRIVAASYFVDTRAGIRTDGRDLTGPYELTVIGEPDTMAAALNIPGGVVDTVRRVGGRVELSQRDTVQVTVTRALSPPRYAEPVS